MMLLLAMPALAADLLFVGNSYTFVNALDQAVDALVEEGSGSDANTERLAEGGYTFANHVSQTQTAGTAWETALVEPSSHWDWIFLQEQSQIPGFPHGNAEWISSRDAAITLDDLSEARGASTVFLLTWGRRAGDDTNPELYPDFSTMQAALTDGYIAYRDATSTAERPTWIAPVGPAFAAVYAESAAAGDPLDPGATFFRLYSDDGSHPSPLGTYLAACVIYATITGESPEGLTPLPGVPAQDAAWPQALAWAVVNDATLAFTYPWTGENVDSAAPIDSGEPADSGVAASDRAASDSAGCGCSHGPNPLGPDSPVRGALLGLGLLVSIVRRRRVRSRRTR